MALVLRQLVTEHYRAQNKKWVEVRRSATHLVDAASGMPFCRDPERWAKAAAWDVPESRPSRTRWKPPLPPVNLECGACRRRLQRFAN